MTPIANSSQKKKTSTRLFPFTEAEEASIKRAMWHAAKYMRTYGKGREPMLIDITKYLWMPVRKD